MKTDYPELEGRKLLYYNGCHSIPAVVIGCSYHIGITIVSEHNPNQRLLCLNKKTFNDTHDSGTFTYRQFFHYVVKQIKRGHYDVEKACKARNYQVPPLGASAGSCAFI